MTPFNLAIVKWIRLGFTFEGRATRSDYWWPRLLVFGVNLLCVMVFVGTVGEPWIQDFIAWSESPEPDLGDLDLSPIQGVPLFALVFIGVFGLLTLVPDLAVAWRRFHDLGQPGWIHILFILGSAFLPLVTLAELIWFAFPGTRGSNRYGPDPRPTEPDIFD